MSIPGIQQYLDTIAEIERLRRECAIRYNAWKSVCDELDRLERKQRGLFREFAQS